MKYIYTTILLMSLFSIEASGQSDEKSVFTKKLAEQAENRFYERTGDTILGNIVKAIIDNDIKGNDTYKDKYITVNPRTVAIYLNQDSLSSILQNENQLYNETVSYLKNIERVRHTAMYISPQTDDKILLFRKNNFDINHYLYSAGIESPEADKIYKEKLIALEKLVYLKNTGLAKRDIKGKSLVFKQFDVDLDFSTAIFNKLQDEVLLYYETNYGSTGYYYLKKINNAWVVSQKGTIANDVN